MGLVEEKKKLEEATKAYEEAQLAAAKAIWDEEYLKEMYRLSSTKAGVEKDVLEEVYRRFLEASKNRKEAEKQVDKEYETMMNMRNYIENAWMEETMGDITAEEQAQRDLLRAQEEYERAKEKVEYARKKVLESYHQYHYSDARITVSFEQEYKNNNMEIPQDKKNEYYKKEDSVLDAQLDYQEAQKAKEAALAVLREAQKKLNMIKQPLTYDIEESPELIIDQPQSVEKESELDTMIDENKKTPTDSGDDIIKY